MQEEKRIVVVGATGEIGRALSQHILQMADYELVVFSRDPDRAKTLVPGAIEYVAWQPEEIGAWASAIDGAYAVVNLAGAPAFGTKWTSEYRKQLRENRIMIAQGLVRAMEQASVKPQVYINGSSVGSYGFTTSNDKEVNEETTPDNDSYAKESLEVEQEAKKAEHSGIRTVLLRTSFVIDRNGGGLPQMAQSMRRYMGGVILPGSQWMPWIHIDDEVHIILKAIADERVRGPINATAPDVPTNRTFMKTMGNILHRPIIMRLPVFMLRAFLGDGAAILTRGRRVVPGKMLQLGYQFQYPTLKQALLNLLQ